MPEKIITRRPAHNFSTDEVLRDPDKVVATNEAAIELIEWATKGVRSSHYQDRFRYIAWDVFRNVYFACKQGPKSLHQETYQVLERIYELLQGGGVAANPMGAKHLLERQPVLSPRNLDALVA